MHLNIDIIPGLAHGTGLTDQFRQKRATRGGVTQGPCPTSITPLLHTSTNRKKTSEPKLLRNLP
jgi:hypothetical protein